MVDCAALLELAVRHQESGALIQAEALYRQVLEADPANSAAYSNLGVILQATGRKQEALECFAHAVRCNPGHADAHSNLGNALQEQRCLVEAIDCFRQALRIEPGHVGALYNLGNTYAEQGRLLEAAHCYRQALAINSAQANVHFNLGNVLRELGRTEEAIVCYREALRINPRDARTHNNLGNVLRGQGQETEAFFSYQEALRLHPGHVGAHINLGEILKDRRQLDEALEHYECALRIEPDHGIALLNRSLVRLLKGDFERGWHDYEQRLKQADLAPRIYQRPRWDGSPLEGKTILLHAEQGLGDTVQFIRYAPLIKRMGGTVIVECQPPLLQLLRGMAGVDKLVAAGAPLPPFDVQAPLLSIPGIMGTTPATIPAAVPYLRADAGLVQHWRRELHGALGLKVGIAWHGNPGYRADAQRSVPLQHFESLARVEGVTLLGLQVGAGTEELLTSRFPVVDLGSRFDTRSLADLAAVLVNLDLVVTVDTSVAHVAGALGVPVRIVLSFASDWRWLLERADSPWYPSARLFRQSRLGEWRDVFERVASAMRMKKPTG